MTLFHKHDEVSGHYYVERWIGARGLVTFSQASSLPNYEHRTRTQSLALGHTVGFTVSTTSQSGGHLSIEVRLLWFGLGITLDKYDKLP